MSSTSPQHAPSNSASQTAEVTGCCAEPLLGDPGQDSDLRRQATQLHGYIGELMRIVQLRDRDSICCHDLSVTQCHALRALVQRPMRSNDLAAELYLEKSTTSRVVDALVSKGWVTRERHPEDGRARWLTATEQGRKLSFKIEQQLISGLEALVGDFEPEVREGLLEILSRLIRAAGDRVDVGSGCCRWKDA